MRQNRSVNMELRLTSCNKYGARVRDFLQRDSSRANKTSRFWGCGRSVWSCTLLYLSRGKRARQCERMKMEISLDRLTLAAILGSGTPPLLTDADVLRSTLFTIGKDKLIVMSAYL